MLRFFLIIIIVGFYVLLSLILFPFYILSKRKLGGVIFKNCSSVLLKSCGVRCKTEGLENITPGETYLVVANHQSIADIPIIGANIPLNMRVLAKKNFSQSLYSGRRCGFTTSLRSTVKTGGVR